MPIIPSAIVVPANIDDLSVTLEGARVIAQNYVYDAGGDNWDRMRGSAAGLLVDTELPAAGLLANGLATPTTPMIGANLLIFNGATWDFVREGATAGSLIADTELPAAALLADNAATPTAPAVGSFGMVFDGATWDRMPGNSADGLLVNLGANNDVTITGAVDTELAAAAALSDAFVNPTTAPVGAFNMGFDGTDWERLRVLQAPNAVTGRAVGSLAVGKTEGKATYRIAFRGLAGVTGVAVRLAGNATTIVRVTKINFAKPSVAQAPLRLVKTSTAATGGTATTPTPIPLDSADAAAVSVVSLYTVAPTGGTEVGTGSVFEGDVGTGDVLFEVFGDEQNAQSLVLRGIAENLEIELSADATIDGYLEWTEE